ncbi:hypothetical protein HDU93_008780 [Gonapodya sp. JEL0774]|nr:hypothetical protein HDU93_008780 [Gonapodya sp. JEL0774]
MELQSAPTENASQWLLPSNGSWSWCLVHAELAMYWLAAFGVFLCKFVEHPRGRETPFLPFPSLHFSLAPLFDARLRVLKTYVTVPRVTLGRDHRGTCQCSTGYTAQGSSCVLGAGSSAAPTTSTDSGATSATGAAPPPPPTATSATAAAPATAAGTPSPAPTTAAPTAPPPAATTAAIGGQNGSNNATATGGSSGLSLGVIVGIAAGGALLLVAIIVAVFLVRRNRRNKEEATQRDPSLSWPQPSLQLSEAASTKPPGSTGPPPSNLSATTVVEQSNVRSPSTTTSVTNTLPGSIGPSIAVGAVAPNAGSGSGPHWFFVQVATPQGRLQDDTVEYRGPPIRVLAQHVPNAEDEIAVEPVSGCGLVLEVVKYVEMLTGMILLGDVLRGSQGQFVVLQTVFQDGWGVGTNITTEQYGVLPIDCLALPSHTSQGGLSLLQPGYNQQRTVSQRLTSNSEAVKSGILSQRRAGTGSVRISPSGVLGAPQSVAPYLVQQQSGYPAVGGAYGGQQAQYPSVYAGGYGPPQGMYPTGPASGYGVPYGGPPGAGGYGGVYQQQGYGAQYGVRGPPPDVVGPPPSGSQER